MPDPVIVDDTPSPPAPAPAPATTAGVVSRRLMPFAPLVIAMLAQTSLIGNGVRPGAETAENPADTPAVCAEEIPTYQECHSEYPNGCSKAAGYDSYVNLLKNQLFSTNLAP